MKAIYFLCLFLSTTFLGLSKNYLVETKDKQPLRKEVTNDYEYKANYDEDSEYGSEYEEDENVSEYDDEDDDEDEKTSANDEQFNHLPGGGD